MTQPHHRFYVTGGSLPPDNPSYVERAADRELHDALLAGEFCYVLTARQMGKSSLMVRTAARLQAAGIAVVVLDLTALGQHLTVEQWYDGLLSRLGRQLDLEEELEEYWLAHDRHSPLRRWMAALHEVAAQRWSWEGVARAVLAASSGALDELPEAHVPAATSSDAAVRGSGPEQ